MCELAHVKTFPDLKLQFAFSGASVLQLISNVGTEKTPHQTPYSSRKLYSLTPLKHFPISQKYLAHICSLYSQEGFKTISD